ncbi:MAG: hypothetical protein PHW82_10590 [Bacteroidales bacterium]|nr:hypothetical protein [Bacteroidales bacterium]
MMKRFFLIVIIIIWSLKTSFSQTFIKDQNTKDFIIESFVSFAENNYTGDSDENKSAIYFTLKIKNLGDVPIPNLGPIKRSEYVNFIVNDSINNPLSLYNGADIAGNYMLSKGEEDTYTWWISNNTSIFGEVFTVQWQYIDTFSQKHIVNVKTRTVDELRLE